MNTSEWLNAWAEPWASFMSRSTIDSALAFGIVGLVWLALRQRLSAQAGYILFLLVLVKLILPGVISLPGLIHAWLPAPEAVTAGTGGDEAWWRFGPLRGAGGGAPVPASAPVGSVMEREAAAGLSLAAWLMLGWAAAVAVMVARFGEYQWFLRSWARRIRPVKGKAWQAEMEDLSRRAGLHQTVPWKTAFWVESPAVWGFRHPVILVPPGFTRRFSREQIRWILLHELAHIRRGDAWARLAQGLFQIAFFFNPVVLAANRIVDCLREYACDDAALLASAASRHECGEGLLGIATQTQARPVLMPYALGLSRNGRFIGRRIMRILDEKRNLQIGLNMKSSIALLLFAALVLPIGGTVAVGQTLGWVKIETQVSPAPRRGFALAYDKDREKVLLFGGFNIKTRAIHNDTWEWDGNVWWEVPIDQSNRPEPRFIMPVVYDSVHKKIVMYGGGDVDKWIGYEETWEFDGQQWSKKSISGPGVRYGHGMAFDEVRGKVVVFGGMNSQLKQLNDFWEYDGNMWTQIKPSVVPSPRAFTSMAYDSNKKLVYIFGGSDNAKAFNELWTWDGINCKKISESGPVERILSGMAYDSKRKMIVIFGGGSDVRNGMDVYKELGDTWEWDGNQWYQINCIGPISRLFFMMAYDMKRDKIVMFGGTDNKQEYGDSWELGLVTSGLKASLWSKY